MNKALKEAVCGKRVAMTGATGGLGREICFYLADAGAALILADRNSEKSEQLEREIKSRYEAAELIRVTADLSDIESVRRLTEKLIDLKPDFFISNAGAYSIPRCVLSTGLDNVFQINFASPYYIIRRLTAALPDIRVVAVGSIAHRYSKTDMSDSDFKTRKGSALVYGNSKRFLMLSLYKHFENDERGRLSVVHPGITFTNITAHYPRLVFAIIKHPMKVIFMKPRKAALCITEGLIRSTPYLKWIGPRFFDVWGRPKLKYLRKTEEKEIAEVYAEAERIYSELKRRRAKP